MRVIGYIIVALFSVLLIFAGFAILFAPPVSPNDIAVASVTGTLAENPDVNNYGKNRSVRLLLNEYPANTFVISGDAFEATAWGMINDYVGKGDTVHLEVAAEDYNNNIQKPPTQERFPQVAVYAFQGRGQVFLTLTNYCKEANSNNWIGVVIIIFGGGFAFALYYELRNKKKREIVSTK